MCSRRLILLENLENQQNYTVISIASSNINDDRFRKSASRNISAFFPSTRRTDFWTDQGNHRRPRILGTPPMGLQLDRGRVNNTSGGLDVQTSLIKVGGARSQSRPAPQLFVATTDFTPTPLIRTTMSIIQVSPCTWYSHLTRLLVRGACWLGRWASFPKNA